MHSFNYNSFWYLKMQIPPFYLVFIQISYSFPFIILLLYFQINYCWCVFILNLASLYPTNFLTSNFVYISFTIMCKEINIFIINALILPHKFWYGFSCCAIINISKFHPLPNSLFKAAFSAFNHKGFFSQFFWGTVYRE